MIGAGPAGLTYASLVAERNAVTIFERDERAGGAFRYAGKAPLFQEVVANQDSFDRYVQQLVAACAAKGVVFRYGIDVDARAGPAGAVRPDRDRDRRRATASASAGFATLAARRGAGRWPVLRRMLSAPAVRDWFYHRRPPADRRRRPAARAARAEAWS